LSFGGKPKAFPILHLLLNLYAPNFAKPFEPPAIQGIKIEDVPFDVFVVFLGWLVTEAFRDVSTRQQLKETHWVHYQITHSSAASKDHYSHA
jgi:hypothetical protein